MDSQYSLFIFYSYALLLETLDFYWATLSCLWLNGNEKEFHLLKYCRAAIKGDEKYKLPSKDNTRNKEVVKLTVFCQYKSFRNISHAANKPNHIMRTNHHVENMYGCYVCGCMVCVWSSVIMIQKNTVAEELKFCGFSLRPCMCIQTPKVVS